MEWYLFMGFLVSTLAFYLLGNKDGENRSIDGLIVWIAINGAIFIWLVSAWWAMRGK